MLADSAESAEVVKPEVIPRNRFGGGSPELRSLVPPLVPPLVPSMAASMIVAAFLAAAPAVAADSPADCLAQALRSAAPDTNVGELRARCAPESDGLAAEVSNGVESASSTTDLRDRRERSYRDASFGLLPHRPTYFLPVSFTEDLERRSPEIGENLNTEIKFQLSFKLPLFGPMRDGSGAFFVAYTLQAWWQAYQFDRSNPFRDYNHEPEFFYSLPTDMSLGGWRIGRIDFGFAHQSNGREEVDSRSWNRLFVDLRAERGNWWTSIRPWWRIPETVFRANSRSKDDNRDIGSFYGYGEWRIGHQGASGTSTTTMLRWNPGSGKGAVQFDLSTPTAFNPRIRWYLQGFAGYGESLADYNRRIRRVSIGLMFSDWY